MIVAATADPALLDPGFSLGAEPLRLSQSHPLGSAFVFAAPPTRVAAAEIPQPVDAMPVPRPGDDVPLPPETSPLVENEAVPLPPPLPADDTAVPLPAPRPVFSAPAAPTFVPARNRLAMRPSSSAPAASATAASAPADGGNFLQKFFGMLKPTGPALGYAAPEDVLLGRLRGSPFVPSRAYDHWTAVYDIIGPYRLPARRHEARSPFGPRRSARRSAFRAGAEPRRNAPADV